MPVEPGSSVGLYASNCASWVVAEQVCDHLYEAIVTAKNLCFLQACYAQSLVTVPLYDTLGPDVVEFISNQSMMIGHCLYAWLQRHAFNS